MRGMLNKICAAVMAIVIVLSTMSYTFNLHFCGDTIVETTLFLKAKGCGMEMKNISTQSCSLEKKNCCGDKQLLIEGQDELHLIINKISSERLTFLSPFAFSYFNVFEISKRNVSHYEKYKPPLVVRPIYKIDETYLI